MTVEKYAFEDVELLGEGPVSELSFSEWVQLCGGDEDRARLFLNFETDVVEPLSLSWTELPFKALASDLKGRDKNVSFGSSDQPRHAA